MIITRTPLRISFTGGGTDLSDYYRINGGAVVSMAINKYIYVTVNRKFDNNIRVSYSQTENVTEVDELHHELVREAMRMAEISGGVEVTSIADIPAGTGLGSSSAFTVGVLNALYTYRGKRLSGRQLAQRACEIEIDLLGHPIGKQDQYAAAHGGLNYFQFNADESVSYQRIVLSDDDWHNMNRRLMLFYTGITRSADGVLAEQKKNTAAKLDSLDDMKRQADRMCQELTEHGFNAHFGEALHQGWMKKRELAGAITNPTISALYEKALAAGALGGKLLGAGGGGFLLFYCEEQNQPAVRGALGLRQIDFAPDFYGSRVIYFA